MADNLPSRDVCGVLCIEGSPTGDGRMIDTNALRWTLPLPLRRVREDFGAHNGAVVVGAIEKIERTDTGELAYSGKLFDTVDGRDAYDEMYTRYEASGLKYGISVDLDDVVIEEAEDTMVVKEGRLRGATLCDIPAYPTAYTMLSGQIDLESPTSLAAAAFHTGVQFVYGMVEEGVGSGREDRRMLAVDGAEDRSGVRVLRAGAGASADLGAVGTAPLGRPNAGPPVQRSTVCSAGASGAGDSGREQRATVGNAGAQHALQAGASSNGGERIPADGNESVGQEVRGESVQAVHQAALLESLVAAAPRHGTPTAWYLNPKLSGPTPLTVTKDGRVYGHAALWSTCHTGYSQDMCITAPRSRSGYAYYRTGAIVTAEGESMAVGHITMGTGHASARMAAVPAADHYDNTGAAVADVAAGEDEFGIWLAGAVREGVSEAQIREMQASAVSGDWRTIDGSLELVAMLSVNVPGFPVPRMRAVVASGEVTSLVASAVFDTEANVEEQSTEMAPEAVLEAVAPVEVEVEDATAPDDDDKKDDGTDVEDQPDADEAEEVTPEEVEDEFDAKAEISELKNMLSQALAEIAELRNPGAIEPESEEPAEDVEPTEPIPADDSKNEDILAALDAIVAGEAPNLAKLLAELDAKVA